MATRREVATGAVLAASAIGTLTSLLGWFFVVMITIIGTAAGHADFRPILGATLASTASTAVLARAATILTRPPTKKPLSASAAVYGQPTVDRYKQLKAELAAGPGPEVIPSDYFMAEATCPKCGVQGFHGLREPHVREDQFSAEAIKRALHLTHKLGDQVPPLQEVLTPAMRERLTDHQQELALHEYNRMVADLMDLMRTRAVEFLAAPEKSYDVIRTCTSCDFSWGQKVGR